LLEGLVSKAYWKKMRQWLKNYAARFNSMAAIGSGGNINADGMVHILYDKYKASGAEISTQSLKQS